MKPTTPASIAAPTSPVSSKTLKALLIDSNTDIAIPTNPRSLPNTFPTRKNRPNISVNFVKKELTLPPRLVILLMIDPSFEKNANRSFNGSKNFLIFLTKDDSEMAVFTDVNALPILPDIFLKLSVNGLKNSAILAELRPILARRTSNFKNLPIAVMTYAKALVRALTIPVTNPITSPAIAAIVPIIPKLLSIFPCSLTGAISSFLFFSPSRRSSSFFKASDLFSSNVSLIT